MSKDRAMRGFSSSQMCCVPLFVGSVSGKSVCVSYKSMRHTVSGNMMWIVITFLLKEKVAGRS